MKYIKVLWIHSLLDQPSVLYSELDDNRYETRKVEVFRDGTYGFASEGISSRNTELGLAPVPSLEEIADEGEFVPSEITKEEFEEMWIEAVYIK